jgi:hypothetical protein
MKYCKDRIIGLVLSSANFAGAVDREDEENNKAKKEAVKSEYSIVDIVGGVVVVATISFCFFGKDVHSLGQRLRNMEQDL